jgi:hypothetical protein
VGLTHFGVLFLYDFDLPNYMITYKSAIMSTSQQIMLPSLVMQSFKVHLFNSFEWQVHVGATQCITEVFKLWLVSKIGYCQLDS